ncbi:collagen alpha-1(I) chain-like [Dipodomys spectabilis]|uniref:collagen alpha-1(I) chain-like n=1 Tax=Dipodomys spectabilis TaxID=105255 RepID=UPI001C53BC3F|nr:collagen alpha-1(I) chain-like [Dipodomys spectabilis]
MLHLPGAAGETGRWCALGGLERPRDPTSAGGGGDTGAGEGGTRGGGENPPGPATARPAPERPRRPSPSLRHGGFRASPRLAHALDSLVRVSRRVGWVADVAADPQPDSGKTRARRAGGRYRPHTVHGLGLDQKDLGPPRAAPGSGSSGTAGVGHEPAREGTDAGGTRGRRGNAGRRAGNPPRGRRARLADGHDRGVPRDRPPRRASPRGTGTRNALARGRRPRHGAALTRLERPARKRHPPVRASRNTVGGGTDKTRPRARLCADTNPPGMTARSLARSKPDGTAKRRPPESELRGTEGPRKGALRRDTPSRATPAGQGAPGVPTPEARAAGEAARPRASAGRPRPGTGAESGRDRGPASPRARRPDPLDGRATPDGSLNLRAGTRYQVPGHERADERAGGGRHRDGRARGPVRRQQREGGARARPLPATRARNPDPPRPPPQAGGRHDPPATCLNPGNRLAHPAARAPRGRHRTRPHPPGRRRPRDPSRPPYRSFLSSLAPPRQLNPSAAAGNTGTGEGPHRHGRPGNGRVPPPRPAPTCESGSHGDGRRRRRGKDGDDDEEEPRGTAAPETPADRGRPPSRRIVKFDRLLSTPPGPWADPGGADPRASLNHPIEAGPNSLTRTDAGAERTATRAAADRRCRQGVGGPRRRPVGDKSPATGGGRRRRQGPREAGDTKPNAREHAHTRTPPAQSGQGQAREPGSRRARGGDTPREHNTPDPGQGRGRSHTARDGGDDAMRASLRTAKREGGAGTRDNIAQAREAAPSGRRHVVTPASGPSDGQLPSEGRTRESHHHRPRGVPAVPLAGTLVVSKTDPGRPFKSHRRRDDVPPPHRGSSLTS